MSDKMIGVGMDNHGALRPRNLTEAIELAKHLAHSGMVPKHYIGNPGAIIAALQYGAEVGLAPMAALKNIAVINGHPSLWGDAALAVVQVHPDCKDVIEKFDEKTMTATCTIKRKGRSDTVCTFSKANAEKAGLWKKQGPWQQYPQRMLQMRARGFALRDAFPDALCGLMLAEEARDIVVDVALASEPKSLGNGSRTADVKAQLVGAEVGGTNKTKINESVPPLSKVVKKLEAAQTIAELEEATALAKYLPEEDKEKARELYREHSNRIHAMITDAVHNDDPRHPPPCDPEPQHDPSPSDEELPWL